MSVSAPMQAPQSVCADVPGHCFIYQPPVCEMRLLPVGCPAEARLSVCNSRAQNISFSAPPRFLTYLHFSSSSPPHLSSSHGSNSPFLGGKGIATSAAGIDQDLCSALYLIGGLFSVFCVCTYLLIFWKHEQKSNRFNQVHSIIFFPGMEVFT